MIDDCVSAIVNGTVAPLGTDVAYGARGLCGPVIGEWDLATQLFEPRMMDLHCSVTPAPSLKQAAFMRVVKKPGALSIRFVWSTRAAVSPCPRPLQVPITSGFHLRISTKVYLLLQQLLMKYRAASSIA